MGKRENNIILNKTMDFAIRIVNLYKHLCSKEKEFVLSKQVLRSGTSIGANLREADEAISPADFISKVYIALKEARETEYWIDLLYKTSYISEKEHQSIISDLDEILRILIAIIKSKKNQN